MSNFFQDLRDEIHDGWEALKEEMNLTSNEYDDSQNYAARMEQDETDFSASSSPAESMPYDEIRILQSESDRLADDKCAVADDFQIQASEEARTDLSLSEQLKSNVPVDNSFHDATLAEDQNDAVDIMSFDAEMNMNMDSNPETTQMSDLDSADLSNPEIADPMTAGAFTYEDATSVSNYDASLDASAVQDTIRASWMDGGYDSSSMDWNTPYGDAEIGRSSDLNGTDISIDYAADYQSGSDVWDNGSEEYMTDNTSMNTMSDYDSQYGLPGDNISNTSSAGDWQNNINNPVNMSMDHTSDFSQANDASESNDYDLNTTDLEQDNSLNDSWDDSVKMSGTGYHHIPQNFDELFKSHTESGYEKVDGTGDIRSVDGYNAADYQIHDYSTEPDAEEDGFGQTYGRQSDRDSSADPRGMDSTPDLSGFQEPWEASSLEETESQSSAVFPASGEAANRQKMIDAQNADKFNTEQGSTSSLDTFDNGNSSEDDSLAATSSPYPDSLDPASLNQNAGQNLDAVNDYESHSFTPDPEQLKTACQSGYSEDVTLVIEGMEDETKSAAIDYSITNGYRFADARIQMENKAAELHDNFNQQGQKTLNDMIDVLTDADNTIDAVRKDAAEKIEYLRNQAKNANREMHEQAAALDDETAMAGNKALEEGAEGSEPVAEFIQNQKMAIMTDGDEYEQDMNNNADNIQDSAIHRAAFKKAETASDRQNSDEQASQLRSQYMQAADDMEEKARNDLNDAVIKARKIMDQAADIQQQARKSAQSLRKDGQEKADDWMQENKDLEAEANAEIDHDTDMRLQGAANLRKQAECKNKALHQESAQAAESAQAMADRSRTSLAAANDALFAASAKTRKNLEAQSDAIEKAANTLADDICEHLQQ